MFPSWFSHKTAAAVLLIVFGLASLGEPLIPARAADDPDFKVTVWPSQEFVKPLCVGETLNIRVGILRGNNNIAGSGNRMTPTVVDPKVGSMRGALIDPENYVFGEYTYNFTAKKVGQTTVKFDADIISYSTRPGSDDTVIVSGGPIRRTGSIDITVKKCKAKVQGVHRFSGDGFLLEGTLDETEMTADEQGIFTGSGIVSWLGQVALPPDCEAGSYQSDEYAPSQVELSGQMDEDGRLTVQLTYQPVQDSVTFHCERFGLGPEDWSGTAIDTPEAFSLSVPAEGAVTTRSQGMTTEQGSSWPAGTVVLAVIPEEDEAVSSLPGSRADLLSLDGKAFWGLIAELALSIPMR